MSLKTIEKAEGAVARWSKISTTALFACAVAALLIGQVIGVAKHDLGIVLSGAWTLAVFSAIIYVIASGMHGESVEWNENIDAIDASFDRMTRAVESGVAGKNM